MKTALSHIVTKLKTPLICLSLIFLYDMPVYAADSSAPASRMELPIAILAVLAGILCAKYYSKFVAARNKKYDQIYDKLKKKKDEREAKDSKKKKK